MASIKIKDISKNKKITKEELRNVVGGFSWGSIVSWQNPWQSFTPDSTMWQNPKPNFSPRHQNPKPNVRWRWTEKVRRPWGKA